MNAIVWGAGGTTKDFFRKKIMNNGYDVVCVVDNNKLLWGTCIFEKYVVQSPDKIVNFQYDVIIICSIYYHEIKKQLIDDYGISDERIITYKDIEKRICNAIIKKYENSKEKDMVDTLNEFRKGNVSILGSYNPPYTEFSEVHREESGFPFILFEGKRMYYPKNYLFNRKDGKEVVEDILYEQKKNSPHLYIPEGYKMPENAVIVDAGVCEGNFALRYVENAKKIYLVEADDEWTEALQMTFKPYADKVVFCNKFLSGHNNANEITLDALIDDRLDFLKMDIEGAEVDALLGGKEVLTNNRVQCAICSYHRQYDEKYIEHILRSYGYDTKPSDGYMFFAFDENMVETMDLRRGVIYGSKN
ncbi:MAG: FkbM family methyltransferase [Lachnospiraceae bacterium]|nr:FkbM family methyltransferase [Lachnospiraceae bacterium]